MLDMYPTTDLLRLDVNMTMPMNHLLDRYESEEEALSEPDQGDHAFSPVISQRAAEAESESESDSNSDLSADGSGCESTSSNENENESTRLLSLSPNPDPGGKASRPVSMDTIKCTSAQFDKCQILDRDDPDDVIIELPSTDDEVPIQSPVFLQPTVYVPESPDVQLQRQTSSASVSSSKRLSQPGSPMLGCSEEEEGDVRVAEQVTYKPVTRPNLIIISSFGRAGTHGLGVSAEQKSDRRLSPADVSRTEEDMDGGVSPKTVPTYGASATITSLSEVPSIPYTFSSRPGTRSRPTSIVRPKTSTAGPGPEKGTRARLDSTSTNVNPIRRPPSTRSLASLARSTPNSPQPSPAPYYSSPTFHRNRSGSSSTTMTTGHLLRSQLKHAASPSMMSMSSRSIRSEIDADAESVYTLDSSTTLADENPNSGSKSLRKRASRGRALGRIRQKPSPSISASAAGSEHGRPPTAGGTTAAATATATATAKGFMGFMLGRKKTVTTGSK